MGRLIVEQIVAADGYAAQPVGGMSFVPQRVEDADQGLSQLAMLRRADAVALGRKTYEESAGLWAAQ